jgi:tetratricopeptide (TPR) repeat protein
MKAPGILRSILCSFALVFSFCLLTENVRAQDVGGDVGGGAGIFRPKNPEAKRKPKTGTNTTKPTNRNNARVTGAAVADRIEELLDDGNTARDSRKFAQAEEAYQSVLKLRPKDARAAYGLGNIYSDQQRWEDAETAYRNAVTWSPNDADAYVALSVVLVQPRAGGDNAKSFADAEAFARKAVQIDPKLAVGWDRLGMALQSRAVYNSETEHSHRRALELDPQFAVAYVHLATVLNRTGRGSEAVPLYDKATELAKDPATLNLIADSLQREQLWPQSETVLKRALELDAQNPTSLTLMGKYLVAYRRYSEAEPFLKTATEVNSKSFTPFILLGRTYLGLDRLQDAEATFEKASALAVLGQKKQLSGVYGFEGVGDGYLKAKQNDSAARVYQRALDLDPGNKNLEVKLARARLK